MSCEVEQNNIGAGLSDNVLKRSPSLRSGALLPISKED